MYANHNISFQVAKAKQRDMLAAADLERLARQARPARATKPTGSRKIRRTWLVRQLRPQAQS